MFLLPVYLANPPFHPVSLYGIAGFVFDENSKSRLLGIYGIQRNVPPSYFSPVAKDIPDPHGAFQALIPFEPVSF